MIHQTKTLFFYKEGVHTKVAMILKVFDLLNIRVIFLYFNCVIWSSCLIGKHVKRRSVGNITEQYQHGTFLHQNCHQRRTLFSLLLGACLPSFCNYPQVTFCHMISYFLT